MQKRIRTGFFVLLLLAAAVFRVTSAAVESGAAGQFWRLPLGMERLATLAMGAEVGQTLRLPEIVEAAPAPQAADGQVEEEAVQDAQAATQPEQSEAPDETEQLEEKAVLAFSQAEAEAITVSGGCTYPVDVAALLAAPLPADFSTAGEEPEVLIIHTHGSEAYSPEAGWEYDPSDTLRTVDPNYNVIRVGREITQQLEAAGIQVIHDETIFDYPSYSGSYTRALDAIESWLAQYPSIQMVIDVHRDAASDESGQAVSTAVEIAGESCARLMFVVGTDEGGMEHPNWEGNLSVALKLQALLGRSAPGLCRDLDLRQERFNQQATPCSLLVEFGSTGDTLQQALRTADYFADAVATLLQSTS